MTEKDIKTTEYFYRNLPKEFLIPDNISWEKRTELQDFIMQTEVRKCKEGVTIDGVFFPPTLYYYWNHCYIDVENENGGFDIVKPDLRDTDWIIHNAYFEANIESLGVIIGALRQVGKTTFLATITSWEISFKKNSEIVALFSSKNDKESYTKKLDIQIKNNTNFLLPEQIDKTWDKSLIRFGMREKDNTTIEFSKLYLLLTEDGTKSQTPAGKSSTLAIFDEIGKAQCKAVHEALLPAMKSQKKVGKLRSSLVYTFTGGDVQKGKDARKIFENPTFNSFKAYKYKEKEIGLFLSGEYHGSYKEKKSLEFFIYSTTGKTIKNTTIGSTPIFVTNWELAKEELDKEEQLALQTDVSAYNSRKMYYPRTPDDIFLSGSNNIYSHLFKELEKINHYLKENPQGRNIEFIEDKGQIITRHSNKGRIIDYPIKQNDYISMDTAIVLLEEPKFQRGQKYYVMGADVYNVVKTAESASLGSWYIIKRQTTDYTDEYADSMVCFYNGRTDLKTFRTQLLYAMRYYGAEDGACTLLHEAADDTFTQWFSEQNKAYMLEDTYNLAKEITPKSNSFAVKGLRATVNNQNYLLSKSLEYCEEDLGDKIGVWRIKDPYLIQQMMNFDGSLADKDSIVAFSHTVGHLYKEKKNRTPHYEENYQEEKKNVVRSIFGKSFKLRM